MKYNLSLIKNKFCEIDIDKKVFYPTQTTKLLIFSILKYFKNKKISTFLDLGCGSGIISLSVSKIYSIKKIYASDLSTRAILCCKKNFKKHKINFAEIKKGSLFLPWRNYKFDVIVNDISGISQKIAKISDWFSGVPCNSGQDGTKLIINVIENMKKHLTKKGVFFFPIISLSNEKKILSCLKKKKIKYKLIDESIWPAPKEMYAYINILKNLKKKNMIDYKILYNKLIFTTKIYVARAN
jgi:methylase of polypeptide subunit release factors